MPKIPRSMSQAEVEALGVSTTITVAAQALGMSRDVAYRSAAALGEIVPGVPVIKAGQRYLVPTRRLRIVLGLEDPDLQASAQQGPSDSRAVGA